MYLPVSPTIPASTNTQTSFASQVQTSELIVNNTLSLFGTAAVGQQNVYPSFESILSVLQSLGLVSNIISIISYVQVQEVIGTGGEGGNIQQGTSVAVSGDGSTLAIGAWQDNSAVGATWIFGKDTDGSWSQRGSKLVGSSAASPSFQGFSVSLSYDGTVLAVGGFRDNGYIGSTWIFVNSGGSWGEDAKLIGSGASGPAYQGCSVSVSGDGQRVAIGALNDNNLIGCTFVFVRGDGWVQEAQLIGTGYDGTDIEQGTSVALNYDGSTLAVGAPWDGFASTSVTLGATWIFTRTDSTWTQQGSKLVGSGYEGNDIEQGTSVALSADGSTLAVGAPWDNSEISGDPLGATWIFVRDTAGVWSQQGSKLVGSGYIGTDIAQGHVVSLTSDGSTLAVGGPSDDGQTGATWIFVRDSGGSWSQLGSKLVGTGYIKVDPYNVMQGSGVSLTADGSELFTGGPNNDNLVGAVWIFQRESS
jgi:hypothetical protein